MYKQQFKFLFILVAAITITSCSGGGGSESSSTPSSGNSQSLPLLNSLDSFDNSGQARSIVVENGFVYVADGSFGLQILSVTPDNKLNAVSSYNVSPEGRAYGVVKNGDYVYLAARKDGLVVVDVSNPANLQSNLSIVEPDPADALNKVIEPSFLQLQGDKLYVSAGNYFLIYDVSDSSTPTEIGRYRASSPNQRVLVSGNYAYIAGYNKGLRILDITNPANPQLTSETTVAYNVRAIEKVGNTVFLGGDDSGLLYLDVSDPAAPELLDELDLPAGAGGETAPYDLYVWKDFLFVADGDAGVYVVGISNPTSPVLGANITTLDSSNGLFVEGTDLYLADYDFVQLVEIFETTDRDGDGVVDGADIFPDDPDESADNDNDGEGDNVDADDDNDTVPDVNDAFPFDPTETTDTDGDGVGDNSDAFVNDPNESTDFDGDGIGGNADLDDDNDGIADISDELPNDPFNLIVVTSDANLNDFPKLDGDQIAWRGYTDKGAPTIYFQDLNDGIRIDLGIGAGITDFHGIPSLSNGQVAWRVWDKVENGGTYTIYLWDGTVGTPATAITSYTSDGFSNKKFGFPPSFHSIDVQIENGALAWAQFDGNDYEIMYRDVSGTIYQITDNDVEDYEAQLNNGQITWTADEPSKTPTNSDFDVFFWDGIDPSNPTIENVSNNPGVPDEDAHLMNGRIAWSGGSGTTNRDIHIWDSVTKEITIVALPGYDYEPQIDNTNKFIAWHNNVSGKLLIYVWDGFDVEVIDYPEMNVGLKSPFANNGRIAFQGRNTEGPDIFIANYNVDKDGDGFINGNDAFPLDPTESLDSDGDGIGNNTDPDDDNDGVLDADDFAPLDAGEAFDTDSDGVGDNADFFPTDVNESADDDLDGIGNNVDGANNFVITPVDVLDTGGQARGVYKDGKYVYVADGTNGLQIYEIQANGDFSPSSVGEFKLPAEPGPPKVDVSLRSVEKVGNYLYLAYREKGLYVVDITDPINPVQIFSYDTPDRATFLEIDGQRLYLSDRLNGILIFDITDPASPTLIGSYRPPSGEIERVLADGDILYVAAYYNGVLILDVSDPADPLELSFTPIPDPKFGTTPDRFRQNMGIWTVEKDGDYLYAGGEGSGLVVLDISNLSNLTEVIRLDLPDVNEELTTLDQPPLKLQKYGTQLFVADGINGLLVVDVSNPVAPFVSDSYQTPDANGTLWDFYIDGYTLISGDHFGGIQHLNLGPTLDNDGDETLNHLDNFENDATLQ